MHSFVEVTDELPKKRNKMISIIADKDASNDGICFHCKKEITGSKITMQAHNQTVQFHPDCLNNKQVFGPGIYFNGNVNEKKE